VERNRRARLEQAEIRQIQRRVEALSPREREVFSLLLTGMLNKQIASELGTTEKTIKVHRGRVMEKMQAGSMAELVRLAGKLGMR
jgi:FixJ family two-component response regulator